MTTKRLLAMALVVMLILSIAPSVASSAYVDELAEADVWARTELAEGIDKRLIPGELQKNYKADASRANIAQLVVNMIEMSTGYGIDAALYERAVTINENAFTDTNDKNILAANALGIINGTGDGKFSPDNSITRAEFAAVISRIANLFGYDLNSYPAVSFGDIQNHWVKSELPFSVAVGIFKGTGNNNFSPSQTLSIQELGISAVRALKVFIANPPNITPEIPKASAYNLSSSLTKGMTASELQEAFEIAYPYAIRYKGMPLTSQLQGIFADLRYLTDTQIQYTDTALHYNDVYGFFVLNGASCAGATRAVGLCLSILGIPYEHVNENQWSHQWCRVEVNGSYWICDAYGMYVGQEPGPYEHPYF